MSAVNAGSYNLPRLDAHERVSLERQEDPPTKLSRNSALSMTTQDRRAEGGCRIQGNPESLLNNRTRPKRQFHLNRLSCCWGIHGRRLYAIHSRTKPPHKQACRSQTHGRTGFPHSLCSLHFLIGGKISFRKKGRVSPTSIACGIAQGLADWAVTVIKPLFSRGATIATSGISIFLVEQLQRGCGVWTTLGASQRDSLAKNAASAMLCLHEAQKSGGRISIPNNEKK